MPRLQEIIAGAVLVGVGLLFAIGMLEVGVRVLHLEPDRFWEPDPILGARLIAGKHGWWTQEEREFVTPVHINQQGLRDVERSIEKPEGTYRILVLGDSYVEAMQVPLEEVFTRRLAARLNREGAPAIEVISAGVSGYGTAAQLLYFNRDGKAYDPDLVLLAFYPGNDLKNNSSELEDSFVPQYGPDGMPARIEAKRLRRSPQDRGPSSMAYRYFRRMVLARNPTLANLFTQLGLLQKGSIRKSPDFAGFPVDYGVYLDPVPVEWEHAWQRTADMLGRLRTEVETTGGKFAIAILSSRGQIYPDLWEQTVAAHPGMHGRQWNMDGPQERAQQWCEEHGVPCVALAPAFRNAAAEGAPYLHYPYDGHFTAEGHALAAKILHTFLEREQLLGAQTSER